MAHRISCGRVEKFEPEAFDELCRIFGPEWLLLTNIPRRISGNEIDACLVSPRGVVVLELKHLLGVIRCPKVGPWIRDGVPEPSDKVTPIDQAELCAQLLKAKIKKTDASLSSATYINSAVLLTHPDCTLDVDPSIDNVGLLKEAPHLINALLARRKSLSSDTCCKILKFITGQEPPIELLGAWIQSESRPANRNTSGRTDNVPPYQPAPPPTPTQPLPTSSPQRQRPAKHQLEPATLFNRSSAAHNYHWQDTRSSDGLFRKAFAWLSVLTVLVIGIAYIKNEIERWWNKPSSASARVTDPRATPSPPTAIAKKEPDLISSTKSQPVPPPSSTVPPPALAQNWVSSFQAAMSRCWELPAGASDPDRTLEVAIRLKRDGFLNGNPLIINHKSDPIGLALSSSIVRALRKCQPYSFLPQSEYTGGWEELRITFSTKSMPPYQPDLPSQQQETSALQMPPPLKLQPECVPNQIFSQELGRCIFRNDGQCPPDYFWHSGYGKCTPDLTYTSFRYETQVLLTTGQFVQAFPTPLGYSVRVTQGSLRIAYENLETNQRGGGFVNPGGYKRIIDYAILSCISCPATFIAERDTRPNNISR
jgi:hypothetical protein